MLAVRTRVAWLVRLNRARQTSPNRVASAEACEGPSRWILACLGQPALSTARNRPEASRAPAGVGANVRYRRGIRHLRLDPPRPEPPRTRHCSDSAWYH